MGMLNGPGTDGLNGAAGQDGTKPAKPAQAAQGYSGKDAECSTWGDEAPTNGGPGYNGGAGATGGNGGHGQDGQNGGPGVIQTIDGTFYSGTITLNYRGGRGGQGGDGGDGQDGGRLLSGGASFAQSWAASVSQRAGRRVVSARAAVISIRRESDGLFRRLRARVPQRERDDPSARDHSVCQASPMI